MRLTDADKLALMLTSAGSHRALASYIGASHQQIGRWLQGERINARTGEITNIPRDPAVAANINIAFEQYRFAVRERASLDGVAYSDAVPILFERLTDFRGAPSLRVVARHTDSLSDALIDRALLDHMASGEYFEIMIQSEVDLEEYLERGEEEYGPPTRRHGKTGERQLKSRRSLIKKLGDGKRIIPIWTRRTNVMPHMIHPEDALAQVHKKLRQKHEPATSKPGTKLRTQIMFSQLPPTYVKPAKVKTARKTRTHKRR